MQLSFYFSFFVFRTRKRIHRYSRVFRAQCKKSTAVAVGACYAFSNVSVEHSPAVSITITDHNTTRRTPFNAHCSGFLYACTTVSVRIYNRWRNGKNLAGSTDESLTSISDTDRIYGTKCSNRSVSVTAAAAGRNEVKRLNLGTSEPISATYGRGIGIGRETCTVVAVAAESGANIKGGGHRVRIFPPSVFLIFVTNGNRYCFVGGKKTTSRFRHRYDERVHSRAFSAVLSPDENNKHLDKGEK